MILVLGVNGITPAQVSAESLGVTFDFEDETTQGWTGRGGVEQLTANELAAHSGKYGLQVTGRTAGWNGPSINLNNVMKQGENYEISAWVRLPEGSLDSAVSLMVQRTTASESFY